MAKRYFCINRKDNKAFIIEKTSNYPFKITEVRILTKKGSIPVTPINVYKTRLRIYVRNNNDRINRKHKLRKKSMFINNYRYYPNIYLCRNQTFVIDSGNKLKRPYNISIYGYEMVN